MGFLSVPTLVLWLIFTAWIEGLHRHWSVLLDHIALQLDNREDKRKRRWREEREGGRRLFLHIPSKEGDYSRDGYNSRKYGIQTSGNFSIHPQFTDLTDHNHHTHTRCPGKIIPHLTSFKNLRLDWKLIRLKRNTYKLIETRNVGNNLSLKCHPSLRLTPQRAALQDRLEITYTGLPHRRF